MADFHHHTHEMKNDDISATPAAAKVEESASVEVGDRGLFDILGKKKENEEKVDVCEEKKEEEKKLHRSSSSSSSSSDEEESVEGGEKKKKNKGLKEKIKEKLKAAEAGEGTTNVPVEKFDDIPVSKPEQKKGFLDKMKEKLPGGKEVAAPPPKPEEVVECTTAEGKEKKGFLNKIKEKITGYNAKSEEKAKEEACN